MGTSSYVLKGTKKSEELTFGSTVHGAGRAKSLGESLRTIKKEDVKKDLDEKGIIVECGNQECMSGEAPVSTCWQAMYFSPDKH